MFHFWYWITTWSVKYTCIRKEFLLIKEIKSKYLYPSYEKTYFFTSNLIYRYIFLLTVSAKNINPIFGKRTSELFRRNDLTRIWR